MITLEAQTATNSSSWTDIVQAIGVLLGVPITIWGVLNLFRKDKEKAAQINALKNIATSQNETVIELKLQIEQLTLQTTEFQHHSNLMLEQNKILEKQLEFQIEAFLKTNEIEASKLKFEKQKRLLEIKPHFYIRSVLFDLNSFEINLINKGHEAKNIKFFDSGVSNAIIKFDGAQSVSSENSVRITGQSKLNDNSILSHGKYLNFRAYITFEDIDGNIYRQNIIKTNSPHIEDPILTINFQTK